MNDYKTKFQLLRSYVLRKVVDFYWTNFRAFQCRVNLNLNGAQCEIKHCHQFIWQPVIIFISSSQWDGSRQHGGRSHWKRTEMLTVNMFRFVILSGERKTNWRVLAHNLLKFNSMWALRVRTSHGGVDGNFAACIDKRQQSEKPEPKKRREKKASHAKQNKENIWINQIWMVLRIHHLWFVRIHTRQP